MTPSSASSSLNLEPGVLQISRQEMMTEEVDDDEGSSVLSRSSSSSSAAEREEEATRNFAQRIFGEEDDEIFSSAFQSRDDVIKVNHAPAYFMRFVACSSPAWLPLLLPLAHRVDSTLGWAPDH